MSRALAEWLEPLPQLEQFRLFACFGPKFGVEEGLRIASWRLSVSFEKRPNYYCKLYFDINDDNLFFLV